MANELHWCRAAITGLAILGLSSALSRAGEEDAAQLAAYFTQGIGETPSEESAPGILAAPRDAKLLEQRSTMETGLAANFGLWKGIFAGPEIRSAARRAGLFFLGMCSVCAVTMLIGRRRGNLRGGMGRREPLDPDKMGIQGSLSVGPGIGIKVVQVGQQRIVVGYDRGGMRSMLVLPDSFSTLMGDSESQSQTLDLTHDNYRPALARMLTHPKDTGWELNHRIPSLSLRA